MGSARNAGCICGILCRDENTDLAGSVLSSSPHSLPARTSYHNLSLLDSIHSPKMTVPLSEPLTQL